jgi:DnaK suppressor protein
MSRATTVKKKSVAKAAKVKKPATRTAASRAVTSAKAAKSAKPAKPAKSARPAAKPAKPVGGPAKAARPAPKAGPKPVAAAIAPPGGRRSEERYAGLSESDLMKAPASQYMNGAQLAFFRERLLAMQRELLEKADLTSEHLRETNIEPDPTDQATIEEEYALELRTRDRERKLLKKIEQALRRIEDGSYGYCEETGDAIGIPRLIARPTATLTIEAQSRRELKQKLYGD